MSTTTTNLSLTKPGRGETWFSEINGNLDIIDTSIGGVNNTIDDLPEVERHTGTFNSTTGDIITLSKAVDAVTEYGVEVVATSRAGSIGDIWVTKATTNFTVKCSAANTTDTFEAIVFHIGDVSSYGGSIYRRYYVSPSTGITDHSVSATDGSLSYVLAAMSGNSGVIELPGNRTYTLTTNSVSIPAGTVLSFQPGATISIASGKTLTFDNPEAIVATPDQHLFSGDGTVVFTHPGTVYAEWWGALGSDAVNDPLGIAAAFAALVTCDGGVLQLLGKNYIANTAFPTDGNNITLRGIAPVNWYTALGDFGGTKITANATGVVLDTPAGTSVENITIENIWFYGLGVGTACIGVRLNAVSGSMIRDCSFENLADQAVYLDGTCVANHFERLKGVNCLLNGSRSSHDGVMQVGDSTSTLITDNFFTNCEMTASLSEDSDANLYVDAWAVYGSTNFFQGCIGELSDIGFWINGDWNKFSICRGDLNFGHGWELTTSALHNQFASCHALRNSNGNDNTYDGFYVGNNGKNSFIGCGSQALSADAWQQRYGFYDGVSGSTSKNVWVGCYGDENQTGLFGGVDFLGAHFPVSPGWKYFTNDDSTPSVDFGDTFIFDAYTGATDITDFDDGSDGKIIRVMDWSTNGYITVKNNANIVTTTGADVNLVQHKLYSFIKLNGVWREF